MGFLRRIFGGGDDSPKNTDPDGIYLYIRTKRAADAVAKIRIDKRHDLQNADYGYYTQKMIVDPKYFSRVQGKFYFDRNYKLTNHEMEGGTLITEEEYETALGPKVDTGIDSDSAAE